MTYMKKWWKRKIRLSIDFWGMSILSVLAGINGDNLLQVLLAIGALAVFYMDVKEARAEEDDE